MKHLLSFLRQYRSARLLFAVLVCLMALLFLASHDPTVYVPASRTVNGHALSSNVTVTNSDLGAVPTTTTVNGHALSGNVSVTASDVGVTPYVSGTTGSIGGGALLVGTPATGTATVTGAAAGRPCYAVPSDGTRLTSIGSGLGVTVGCVVTSTSTATVYVNVSVAGTPVAKTYTVVAFP
jgi:hypothetical protein